MISVSKPEKAAPLGGLCHFKSGTTAPGTWRALLAPPLVGDVDRELQLGPLLFLGEQIALFGGGEAALRGHRKLLQRHETGGLLQPALDVVLLLELAALRGDDADHHDLVALRQIAQRLEAAGALGI